MKIYNGQKIKSCGKCLFFHENKWTCQFLCDRFPGLNMSLGPSVDIHPDCELDDYETIINKEEI
jgi:hypothetical protein